MRIHGGAMADETLKTWRELADAAAKMRGMQRHYEQYPGPDLWRQMRAAEQFFDIQYNALKRGFIQQSADLFNQEDTK